MINEDDLYSGKEVKEILKKAAKKTIDEFFEGMTDLDNSRKKENNYGIEPEFYLLYVTCSNAVLNSIIVNITNDNKMQKEMLKYFSEKDSIWFDNKMASLKELE